MLSGKPVADCGQRKRWFLLPMYGTIYITKNAWLNVHKECLGVSNRASEHLMLDRTKWLIG